jgi:putative colanic acid biosynthesis acetyltransferase WcaF
MENQLKTDLSKFNNDWYKKGGSSVKRISWYILNAVFFNSAFPIMSIKRFLLRLFGAKLVKVL